MPPVELNVLPQRRAVTSRDQLAQPRVKRKLSDAHCGGSTLIVGSSKRE
jgi:hypothetical protein